MRDLQNQLTSQGQILKKAQADLSTALQEKQNIVQELEEAKMLLQMQNVTIDAVKIGHGNHSEREVELEAQLAVITQELKQSSEQITQLKSQIHTSSAPAHSKPPPVVNIKGQDGVELMSIGETAVEAEWKRQKAHGSPFTSKGIDYVMENIFGLDAVKWFFLKTRAKIETMVRQGVDLQHERFDLLITGNPGTC